MVRVYDPEDSDSSAWRMGKYKHNEVKELSEYVKVHTKNKYDLQEGLKTENPVNAKIQKVGEVLMGPKHTAAERCTIFNPMTNELITYSLLEGGLN